eukprot:TRINITY_DN9600_c0_g1_i1.p1 TRINITY_DN9600_c0_g1~~TRINITY_DN9600_c0_g1_i1.p1  ORF type:complete len:830 (-),score=194.65 TRINITY_DN9600_c0_g1_i1:146-2635(-)
MSASEPGADPAIDVAEQPPADLPGSVSQGDLPSMPSCETVDCEPVLPSASTTDKEPSSACSGEGSPGHKASTPRDTGQLRSAAACAGDDNDAKSPKQGDPAWQDRGGARSSPSPTLPLSPAENLKQGVRAQFARVRSLTTELEHMFEEARKRHEDALSNEKVEVAVMYPKDNAPHELDDLWQEAEKCKYTVTAQADIKFSSTDCKLVVFRCRDEEGKASVPAFQVMSIMDGFAKKCEERTDISVWALHNPRVSEAILAAELETLNSETKGMPTWKQTLRKGLRHLRLTVPPEDDKFFDALEDQYGRGVEFSFIWAVFFVQKLWVLTFGCLVWEFFNILTHKDQEHMMRGILKVGTIFWSIFVAVESFRTYSAKARVRCSADGEEKKDSLSSARTSSFKDTERFHEKSVRWVQLLFRSIVMAIFICIACLVLISMTMLVLHVIYIWGDCLHLHTSADEPCRDAQRKWGILGWAVEVGCDVLLAIIFEILMSVGSSLSDWLAASINFKLQSNQMLFKQMLELVLCTAERIGFVGSLAYLFSPQWEPPSLLLLEGKIDLNEKCDNFLFGEDDFRCYQLRLPPDVRRWLFTKLIKGPFVVAPIVGIIVKFLVPSLVRKLATLSRKMERRRGCSKLCSPFRCVLRLLAIIFTYDAGAVDGVPYLCKGWPFSDLPKELPDDARETLQRAIDQSVLKQFEVEDELMELEMNFLWVTFFVPIMPFGVVATLFTKLAEVNTDLGKLLFVRRRPEPVSDFVMRRETNMFMACVAAANIGWSVGLSVITFNDDLWTYDPLVKAVIFWGVVGWIVVSVLIIASTLQYASSRRLQREISPLD